MVRVLSCILFLLFPYCLYKPLLGMRKLPAKVPLFVVTSYSPFLPCRGWEGLQDFCGWVIWWIWQLLLSLPYEGALVVIRPLRLKGKQVKVLYSPAAVSLTKRSSVNHCERSFLWEGAGDGDKSENLPSMCILYLSRGLERCHRTT